MPDVLTEWVQIQTRDAAVIIMKRYRQVAEIVTVGMQVAQIVTISMQATENVAVDMQVRKIYLSQLTCKLPKYIYPSRPIMAQKEKGTWGDRSV